MRTESNIVKGVPAFAGYLGIHPNTLRYWMKRGTIKYTQVMRTIMFDKNDYLVLVEAKKKKGRVRVRK